MVSPHNAARFVRWWVLPGAAAAAMAFWTVTGAAHPGIVGVSWTGTAGRLLETNCVVCHGEGGGARPRLDDYESARLASQAIKQAVLTRHMPRWYAARGFGDFVNDPSLTPHEIELLAQWADGRAPYGDPASIRKLAAPIAIERPDLVLSVPLKYRVAQGSHTFKLPTGLTGPRAIRGWTFRPGNPSLIAAAVIALDSGVTLGTWVPGERATLMPEGLTKRLPAASAVYLTIYYRPLIGPAVDASSVGLYFAAQSGREVAHLSLPCGSSRVLQSIDALAIRPAIGSSGASLRVLARRPDRSIEPLGWFQNYPADHPQTYWFRDAVRLAPGSTIDVGAIDGACGAELEYVISGEPVVRAAAGKPASDGSSADAAAGGYWCPMHATVRSATPGTCTQCGMALVPVTPDVDGKYALDAGLVAGAPGGTSVDTLRLVVREPGTNAVVRRFENVHERPFHLFLVSDDLEEFFHVHPVSRPDGSLELSPVPLGLKPYHLYGDFMPVGGTPQLIGKAVIPPKVAPPVSGPHPVRLVPEMGERTDGSLRVRIAIEDGALVAGTPGLIDFHLQDAATGAPISDLQPYLGAWGHAFILGSDMTDALHSHPLTPLSSPGGPTIVFQQRFPRPGSYRLWAQFMRNGHLSTVSFTVAVTDGSAPTTH